MASRTSSAWVSPSAGNPATPAQTVTPCDDDANAAASRSSSARAGSGSIPGSTSPNSSGPMRETLS